MNATLTTILRVGPLFLDQNGRWHINRTSVRDIQGKLLNGRPCEFGFLSAIREVADVETDDCFGGTEGEYIKIAELVETLAACAGSEFAEQYRVVAGLVRGYAEALRGDDAQ